MGYVARIVEEVMCTVSCWKNLQEKRHLNGLCVDERIILKCLCTKRVRGRVMDMSGSVNGQLAGCCEYGDELLVSKKGGEFCDYITYC